MSPGSFLGQDPNVAHFKGDLFLLLAKSDLGLQPEDCSVGLWELPFAQNPPHVQLEQAQMEREQLPAIG